MADCLDLVSHKQLYAYNNNYIDSYTIRIIYFQSQNYIYTIIIMQLYKDN